MLNHYVLLHSVTCLFALVSPIDFLVRLVYIMSVQRCPFTPFEGSGLAYCLMDLVMVFCGFLVDGLTTLGRFAKPPLRSPKGAAKRLFSLYKISQLHKLDRHLYFVDV